MTSPLPGPPRTSLHTTLFPGVAYVMPFSRDILLFPTILLICLSGATSLRDSQFLQLLGEGVASLCLARARWSEVTEVANPPPPPPSATRKQRR